MCCSKNNVSHTISQLSTLILIVFCSTETGRVEIAGDVQRKIALKLHWCEAVFSNLVHSRIHSCNNTIPKADHFPVHDLISCKYMGAFWQVAVGFEPHSPFLIKNNLSGLRCPLCLPPAKPAGGWTQREVWLWSGQPPSSHGSPSCQPYQIYPALKCHPMALIQT